MVRINTGDSGLGSINRRWINTEHSILKAAEEILGEGTRAARKPWIDQETLELMDGERKYKNAKDEQEKTQNKRLRNELQRRCKKARNNSIGGKCKEIETLFKLAIVDADQRKIKQNFKKLRVNANIVKNKNGKA